MERLFWYFSASMELHIGKFGSRYEGSSGLRRGEGALVRWDGLYKYLWGLYDGTRDEGIAL